MNILYIGHERDLNGASRSLLGIIDKLDKEEINIHVLTSYKGGKFLNELKKRDVNIVYSKYFRWMIRKDKNRIKWIFKKLIFRFLNIFNIVTILKISDYSRKNNIDIIHSNSSVINIGAYISNITKIPHIFHIREFGEEDFNMYPIFNRKRSFEFINKNSKKIIVISNALLEKYKNNFDSKKIKLIYNGVDNKFSRKKIKDNKGKYSALIAGRIEEAKGQKEAILAINELKNKGIDNINLVVIGSGDKKELNKYIVENGLENLIEIRDYSDSLFEIRKDIDFELVCSKNEAFGRVTIEAMMSSNPVIGANTGGTKELIINEYNGYLYEQGNYKDLAQKILLLINNKKFNDISNNAFKYSNDRFTSEINAKNILLLYKEIVSTERI